jgi:hypothetical protein
MSIKLNSVGGGSVTIQEPNTASDFTLSVPAQTANLLTNRTAGTILQVVNGKTSTGVTNTSNSVYADSGLTATITPQFATSKILVLVSQNGLNVDTALRGVNVILLRNGSAISNVAQFFGYGQSQFVSATSINYLDSPATTSATTYKTQFKLGTSTGISYVQDNSSESTITLLEIAG